MAYQLVNAPTGHVNLLQSLETFLTGAGWTIDRSGVLNGNLYELLVSTSYDSGIGAETFSFSLWVTATGDRVFINLAGRTAYSAGTIASQTGHAAGPACSVRSGSMTRAWFFATAQACHVFIEVQPGYFSRFSMGCLERAFTPVSGDKTGQYVCGGVADSSGDWDDLSAAQFNNSYSDTVLYGYANTSNRAAMKVRTVTVGGGAQWCADGAAPRWYTNAERASGASASQLYSPLCPLVVYPRADGSRPLMPVLVYSGHNPAQSIDRFLLGTFPDLRVLYFAGLNAATEFTIGSDTWVAFPVPGHNRNITAINFGQELGWAVKKVP